MNLWHGFDFLANIIAPWMKHNDQCLYNALVIKITKQPTPYLLQVRDSLREIATWIEKEVSERN